MLISVSNEVLDLAAQIGEQRERAAANGALCDQAEPAFDLIELRGIGRCVVQMNARTTREPRIYFDVLVRAVIVDDEVHVELLGPLPFDVARRKARISSRSDT